MSKGIYTGTCEEHGALNNDVKWLKWMTLGGFSLVLSAVIYFNTTSQAQMKEIHQVTSDIKITFLERSARYELTTAMLENRLDSLENFCCSKGDEVANPYSLWYNTVPSGEGYPKLTTYREE